MQDLNTKSDNNDEQSDVSDIPESKQDFTNRLDNKLEELDNIPPPLSKKKTTEKTPVNKKGESGKRGIIETMPREEIIKRTQLITTIMQYKLVFPEHMKSYMIKFDFKYLNNLSFEELKDFLDEVRSTVACLNSGSALHVIYTSCCELIETGSSLLGVDIQGFSEDIMNDPNIINPLNELVLESDLVYIRPEMRLALATVVSIKNRYIINRRKAREPIDPSIINNSKDL